MLKRWPLLLLLLLAVAGGGYLLWQRLGPPQVAGATPTRGVALDAVYATGLVEPSLEIRIAPRTPGRLVELRVDEGDTVRAGQLLARLEDDDLRATVAELAARADYARGLYQRNSELRGSGLISHDAVDRARTDLDAANAALRRARDTLSQMRLTAPSAGRIIRRDGEIGEYLPVNTPLFYMAGPEPLRLTADVDEEDVPRIQRGQRVLIRSDAFAERVFEGLVAEITPRGDPVARSYRVRIDFVGEHPLPIGMSTEINIVIEEREDALLVPASAVAGDILWTLDGDRVRRKIVRVGVRSPERVEILSGLGPDEQIVLEPPKDLHDGQRVKILASTDEAVPSPAVEPP